MKKGKEKGIYVRELHFEKQTRTQMSDIPSHMLDMLPPDMVDARTHFQRC